MDGLAPAPPGPAGFARRTIFFAGPSGVAFLLAALVLLGLAARCRHFLAAPSYWYDEAYLLLNVFAKTWAELAGPLDHAQAAPPLYLWLLRALYLLGGRFEMVMRLPSLAASLAAVGLMVPLARRVAGPRGWPWAVALAALSYHGLTHGCEVKPYAGDLLVTECVLLAAAACLDPCAGPAARRGGFAGLAALALLAPWLSFPAVFALGAAGLGLLWRAWAEGTWRAWAAWLLITLLAGLSVLALWLVAGAHQESETLHVYWRRYFFDLSSPTAGAAWLADCLVSIGNYATTGMGIPLALLAVAGLAVVWTASPRFVVLLAGTLVCALAASALHRYPLNDRLVFFAAPCLWLPAAAALGAVARRCRGRLVWVGILLPAAVLLPGAARMGKALASVQPKTAFREAFAYIQNNRQPGDALWLSHPEVFAVYHGKQPRVFGVATPGPIVWRAARGGRLWMALTPKIPGVPDFDAIVGLVHDAGAVPVCEMQFIGLEVVLYEPAGRRSRRDQSDNSSGRIDDGIGRRLPVVLGVPGPMHR
jgi:hypothetical protein